MVSNMQNNADTDDRHRRPTPDNRVVVWAILAIIVLVAAIYALDVLFHPGISSPTLASVPSSDATPGTDPNATSAPTPLIPTPNATP